MTPRLHWAHRKVTTEKPDTDGSIPFLNTLFMPEPHNKILTTLYRKPTHKNQYLHWDIHHNLSAKYSVYSIFTHRARTVCANPPLIQKEEQQVKGGPSKVQISLLNTKQLRIKNNHRCNQNKMHPLQGQHHMVLPYIKGMDKHFKNICNKMGFQVFIEGGTIRSLLEAQGQGHHHKEKWNNLQV